MELKDIQTALNEHASNLKGLLDTQQEEIKSYGETTKETASRISNIDTLIAEIQDELKAAATRIDEFEAKDGRLGYGNDKPISPGEVFVGSDEYKSMLANRSDRTDRVEFKAVPTGALTSAGAGALVVPTLAPTIGGTSGDRKLTVRQLFNNSGADSGAVDYVEEVGYPVEGRTPGFDNQAAAQQEGELKARSGLTFTKKTVPVATVAHWLPVTRQILDDAKQLTNHINNRLIYGLALATERDLLYADGSGDSIVGIAETPSIRTYDWSGGEPGDTKIDAIRRAMTLAALAEYPVDGVVVNPVDWESIELAKGSDGHYLWVSVTDGGVTRLWRAPVVVTTACTSGDFFTGAFGLGATVWDREQANIRVGEPDDYFLRNMIAVLAEERLALTVYRPEAFVLGSFDGAPAGVGAGG